MRLVIGMLLGVALAAGASIFAPVFERARELSSSVRPGSSSDGPSSRLPVEDVQPEVAERMPPSEDVAPVREPADSPPQTDTSSDAVDSPIRSSGAVSAFDREMERLRQLGLDAYRAGIVLMLKGGQVEGHSDAGDSSDADIEPGVAPANLQSLHDDASGLSSDHELIDSLIVELAPRFGLEPRLLHAMCQVESGFNPRAVSPKQAKGAFQLIDATSSRFNVTDPFDPRENLLGALRYLRFLADQFGEERLDLVLSAYNAGEEAVERYGRRVPPFSETRAYVNSVLRLYRNAI